MGEVIVVDTEEAPSARDLEIYHRCEVLGERQTALATEYGITQGRVSQIVSAVEPWVRGQFVSDAWREKLRATERLEFIYAESMQAWQKSIGKQVTTVEDVDGGATDEAEIDTDLEPGTSTAYQNEGLRRHQSRVMRRTVKVSHGDPRYAANAMKAALEIAKLWGSDAATAPLSVPTENESADVLDLEDERERVSYLGKCLFGEDWLIQMVAGKSDELRDLLAIAEAAEAAESQNF